MSAALGDHDEQALIRATESKAKSLEAWRRENTKGGLVVVGQLNLGGSVEMIPNPVAIAEIAAEKRAAVLLMPVATRRQLNDLPDEIWTKLRIEFYADPVDAVFKALVE